MKLQNFQGRGWEETFQKYYIYSTEIVVFFIGTVDLSIYLVCQNG